MRTTGVLRNLHNLLGYLRNQPGPAFEFLMRKIEAMIPALWELRMEQKMEFDPNFFLL